MNGLIIIAALFLLIWLLLIRPQRKRQLEQRRLLADVSVGDEIVTAGGLYGTVQSSVRGRADARDRPGHVVSLGPESRRRVLSRTTKRTTKTRTSRRRSPPRSRRRERSGGRERSAGGPAKLRTDAVSERRSHLALVGLILAALWAWRCSPCPGRRSTRSPLWASTCRVASRSFCRPCPRRARSYGERLDRSVNIIRNRVDKLGVSEPEIRKQGDNQIVVQLAGVYDPKRAATSSARRRGSSSTTWRRRYGPPSTSGGGGRRRSPSRSLYDLLAAVQARSRGRGDGVLPVPARRSKKRACRYARRSAVPRP